jgi:hypothetical protein
LQRLAPWPVGGAVEERTGLTTADIIRTPEKEFASKCARERPHECAIFCTLMGLFPFIRPVPAICPHCPHCVPGLWGHGNPRRYWLSPLPPLSPRKNSGDALRWGNLTPEKGGRFVSAFSADCDRSKCTHRAHARGRPGVMRPVRARARGTIRTPEKRKQREKRRPGGGSLTPMGVHLGVHKKIENLKAALSVAFRQQFCSPRPTRIESGAIRRRPETPVKSGFPAFFCP